jgi:hypothetical protein
VRLNGRAAIMTYMGIRSVVTYRRYRWAGMPVHYCAGGVHKAFALTHELDGWVYRVDHRGGQRVRNTKKQRGVFGDGGGAEQVFARELVKRLKSGERGAR